MTIAMRSHLLNNIVRDWEKIQLPSVNTSAGFILSQEMPTSAVNDALIPVKHCTLGIVSHNSNNSTLPMSRIIFFDFTLSGFYFVADRLEDLVDEDDSRSSSRIHEHDNFRLVSQLRVAIQTPWSRCQSPRDGRTSVHQRVAPFYVQSASTSLSVSLSFSKRSTKNWYSRSQERNVYRFLEHSNGTFVLSQQVALFYELD